MGASGARARQLYVPQPENRSTRFGQSAYAATQNYATNSNTAGGAPAASADVFLNLAAPLTSRTGGRFRAAGSLSGTCTAADVITATMEANINGGGFPGTVLATQLLMGAAAGARFGVCFDVLTPAVTIGQTIDVRIRAVDNTGNNITANTAAAQVTVNLQELPG